MVCCGYGFQSNSYKYGVVGITACFVVLSSYILGNRTVPVYDGAWMDWYQNAPNELKIDIPIDQ